MIFNLIKGDSKAFLQVINGEPYMQVFFQGPEEFTVDLVGDGSSGGWHKVKRGTYSVMVSGLEIRHLEVTLDKRYNTVDLSE